MTFLFVESSVLHSDLLMKLINESFSVKSTLKQRCQINTIRIRSENLFLIKLLWQLLKLRRPGFSIGLQIRLEI